MRASASFCFEDGIRTLSCSATLALRMRVSMSAIGSVIVIVRLLSPAGLRDTGHFACVHHLAQADAAEPELAVHSARSTATAAPRVRPHLELGLGLLLLDQCLLRHALLPFRLDREAERIEEGLALGIGAGGCDDRDVHAPRRVDLVVVDLREDELFGDSERVVPTAVERVGREAAEVADARDRQADQAIEELPHAVAAQRHLAADA